MLDEADIELCSLNAGSMKEVDKFNLDARHSIELNTARSEGKLS